MKPPELLGMQQLRRDVILLQICAKHLAQCISREERKNRNGFGEKSFTGFHPVVHI